MFRFAMITATVLGLAAAPAAAEDFVLNAPGQAATVSGGAIDLVTYFKHTDWDQMEVTAIFAKADWDYYPMRVSMALEDGDRVAFSMPGFPDQLFHFSRTGNALAGSVEQIDFVEMAEIK